MESLSESIKLMFFVYALAAAVSLTVAWILKLIFAGVQRQKAGAEARIGDSGKAAPDKTG